jgi:hypothetical protein
LVAILLALGFPVLAFADEGFAPTDALDAASVEQLAVSPDPAAEPATQETTTGPAEDGLMVLDSVRDVPHNAAPYEPGWSVVNLMALILTILIGVAMVFSSMLEQEKLGHASRNFSLAVISLLAAVLATILFTSTEDIGSHMIAIDNFTVAHIVILAAAIFCAVLSVKRSEEKPELG